MTALLNNERLRESPPPPLAMSQRRAPHLAAIPAKLTVLSQWVCWRYTLDSQSTGRQRKVPLNPRTGTAARINEPETWTDFAAAANACQRNAYDGVGFVFTWIDPFVGLDFDDCRDPTTGQLDPRIARTLEALNSYSEVSPSGTGVKVIVEADGARPGIRKDGTEIYASHRFFTITGWVIPPYSVIREAEAEVSTLYAQLKGDEPAVRTTPISTVSPLRATDEQVLEKARSARNGTRFTQLWEAQANADPSSEDLALCRILAFWCGPRPDRLDRLFRSSRRYRTKWDQSHYADGTTYGQHTVAKAIADQASYYRWK